MVVDVGAGYGAKPRRHLEGRLRSQNGQQLVATRMLRQTPPECPHHPGIAWLRRRVGHTTVRDQGPQIRGTAMPDQSQLLFRGGAVARRSRRSAAMLLAKKTVGNLVRSRGLILIIQRRIREIMSTIIFHLNNYGEVRS